MLITRESLVEGTYWRESQSTLLTTSLSSSETGSLFDTYLSQYDLFNQGQGDTKFSSSKRLKGPSLAQIETIDMNASFRKTRLGNVFFLFFLTLTLKAWV